MRGINLTAMTAGVVLIHASEYADRPCEDLASMNICREVAYSGSRYAWATSPGSYAPRFNQRKARRQQRRSPKRNRK